MNGSGESIWDRLGVPETRDEREIKRAYARRLKERRPDQDAEGFQRLREAYDLALRLCATDEPRPRPMTPRPARPESAPEPTRSTPTPEKEPAPESLPGRPEPIAGHQKTRRRLAQFADALEKNSPEAVYSALDGILSEDLGLTEKEDLETGLAQRLASLDRPPAAAIEAVAARFGWLSRATQVGHTLPASALLLLARRRGYQELEDIQEAGRRGRMIYQILAFPPHGAEEQERAAARLRRSTADRSHLQAIAASYPNAFRFEIDPRLAEWISQQLPEPRPPGPLARLQEWAASVDLEDPAQWPVCRSLYGCLFGFAACLTLIFFVPRGKSPDNFVAYLLLSCFGFPLLEIFRFFVERHSRPGRFAWLPTAALWIVLVLAIGAQIFFWRMDFTLWWAAIMLAIILALEEKRRFRLIARDVAGYCACVLFLVQIVQGSWEAPFGYFFFLPLLHFPGEFFGGKLRLGQGKIALALATLFTLSALTAAAAGGDSRRILLGLALVALFLFLRSMEYRLADLILLPLLVQIPTIFLGVSFDVHPALLLLYLLAFATPFGRSRLREAFVPLR